jgi:uncharacterized membrane protein YeaQ/YmgE (transglycosylase-associated protein family)
MAFETILVWLLVGAIAGSLAGMVIKGSNYGMIGDIIVGIIGAFVGGWLLPGVGLNLGAGLVSVVFSATIGAIALLLVLRLVQAPNRRLLP